MTRVLTTDDVKILDFEREWSGGLGAKESAIRAAFGCSAARYYQRLDALLERRDVVETDPLLVHRLIRVRDELAEMRQNRVLGHTSGHTEVAS